MIIIKGITPGRSCGRKEAVLLKRLLYAIFALCLSVALFGGCSGDKQSDDVLSNLEPKDVIERVFSSLQTNEIENIPVCFSSVIDKDLVTEYFQKKFDAVEIDRFVVPEQTTEKKGLTLVDVKYRYKSKKIDKYGVTHYGQKQVKDITVAMEKENDVWKIRAFEPELTELTEKEIFLRCKFVVEQAKLAEQYYHSSHKKTFTYQEDELARSLKNFKTTGCEVFKIHDIKRGKDGDKDYRISATTYNMPQCDISATREKTFPEKYSRCPQLSF